MLCLITLHPDHEMNWEEMLVTFSKAKVPNDVIQKLLDVQKESFTEQSIDWDQVIDELTKPKDYYTKGNVSDVFRYLVKYSMADRISAIGPRKWRDDMACKLEESFSFFDSGDTGPKGWFDGVSSKLSDYEKEYISLKVATTMIELTLWNTKMTENFQANGHIDKRAKIDETDWRKECRINCGADIVIEHVLPYLL